MSWNETIALLSALSDVWMPLAILLLAIFFYGPVSSFLKGAGKLQIGPLAIERKIENIAQSSRRALIDTSSLQIVLAESRIVELEHVMSLSVVSSDQRSKLQDDLKKIRIELARIRSLREDLIKSGEATG